MRGRTSGRARPSRVFSATRIAITWRRRPSMAPRTWGCRHRAAGAAEGRTASPKWARMRASNDPWACKREELQEHSVLLLNNELLTQPSWDEETIRSRNRRMAELASVIHEVAHRPRSGASGSHVSLRRPPSRGPPCIGKPGPPSGMQLFHLSPPIVRAGFRGASSSGFWSLR